MPAGFLCRYRQDYSKCICKGKSTRITKLILKNKNAVITLSDFKAYSETTKFNTCAICEKSET